MGGNSLFRKWGYKFKGTHIRKRIKLTLEDISKGTKIEVSYRCNTICPDCLRFSAATMFDTCETCLGSQVISTDKKMKFTVRKGAGQNEEMTLRGAGHQDFPGGPAGDLVLIIDILPHDTWTKRGSDCLIREIVKEKQLVRGDNIKIDTPMGWVKFIVPPGTNNGQTFRLTGKGFYDLQTNGHGDALIIVELNNW